MSRWSAERVAKIAIGVQLLVLIRLPLECLRLRYAHGGLLSSGPPTSPGLACWGDLTWSMVAPFIHGELITAILAALAVMLYFAGKHVLTVWTAVLNVAVLVVYKLAWM